MRHNPPSRYAKSHGNRDIGTLIVAWREPANRRGLAGSFISSDLSVGPLTPHAALRSTATDAYRSRKHGRHGSNETPCRTLATADCSRLFRRVLLVSKLHAANNRTASSKNLTHTRLVQDTRRVSSSFRVPQGAGPPRPAPWGHVVPSQRTARHGRLVRNTIRTGHARRLFRRRDCRGYQPRRERTATALQPFRRPPGRSYSRHTPGLERLNHSADRSRAPVTTPAAPVLPGLAVIFIQPVTSLEGVIPRIQVVCAPLPRRHRFHERTARDFCGPKQEAPAYPSTWTFRGSAPSLIGNYRQALAGLSWLSFSPSGLSHPIAEPDQRPGPGPHGRGSSPRRPALNEPDGSCTRIVPSMRDCGPNPAGGFAPAIPPELTAFDNSGRGRARFRNSIAVFLRRPASRQNVIG